MTQPSARQTQNALAAKREDGGTTLSSPGLPVAAGARRGVTLIEAVLFISVALGLIIGGLVFYQQASLAARVNEQVRLFSSMYVEVQTLLSGGYMRTPLTSGALGDINKVLLASGAVSPGNSAGSAADVAGDALWSKFNYYPGDTPTIKTAWDTASFWGEVFVNWPVRGTALEFHITEIGVAECTRFLNSVLNGTLQGNQPDAIDVYNGGPTPATNLVSDYPPDEISEACQIEGVYSGRVNIALFWPIIYY